MTIALLTGVVIDPTKSVWEIATADPKFPARMRETVIRRDPVEDGSRHRGGWHIALRTYGVGASASGRRPGRCGPRPSPAARARFVVPGRPGIVRNAREIATRRVANARCAPSFPNAVIPLMCRLGKGSARPPGASLLARSSCPPGGPVECGSSPRSRRRRGAIGRDKAGGKVLTGRLVPSGGQTTPKAPSMLWRSRLKIVSGSRRQHPIRPQ
jgi:hypothetical protein